MTKHMKGTGTVFRRRRSPFWWIGYAHSGRFIRESSNSTRRDDAKNLLQERLGAIAARTYIGPEADKVTIAELLADLEREYEVAGRASLRTLRGHVKAWNDVLGTVKTINATFSVLTEIIQTWQLAGDAAATINKRLSSLRRAFNLGRAARRIVSVPTFPHLAENNARQGFFEWPVLLELLAALPDDGLRDFIEWAARTGMRTGEIAKLTWRGYDRETGVVRLHGRDAKTRKPRRIVLVGPLAALIARRHEARKTHPECPLIFHRDGQPIGDFRKTWARACRAIDLDPGRAGFTPHDLRRTGLRNMRRAGVPESVAMAISGHLTSYTFKRYDITDDADLREAMEKTTAYTDTLGKEPKRTRPIR
jgi:integrase